MNQKQMIDWQQKADEFGHRDKKALLSFYYEQFKNCKDVSRTLSTKGRAISIEAVRVALHDIGHAIYLKKGQGSRAADYGKVKERQEKKKVHRDMSRIAVKRSVQDNRPWNRRCQVCGKKLKFPRFYTCSETCEKKRYENQINPEIYGGIVE